MKKTIAYLGAVVVAGIAAIAIMIMIGKARAEERYQCLVADFTWTRQLLIQDKQHDRLHEFMKARFYALGACLREADLAYLKREACDYGPVDEAILGDMRPEPPHADTPNDHYSAFMGRIGKR